MPTYSYRCANCDHAFDQYQAFTDDSLTVCPNCGEPQLRKVFNSIGVAFTGSGFYRNDSRAASGGDSGSAAASSSSSGSSSSSESKPAASTSEKKSTPAAPAAKKPAAASKE